MSRTERLQASFNMLHEGHPPIGDISEYRRRYSQDEFQWVGSLPELRSPAYYMIDESSEGLMPANYAELPLRRLGKEDSRHEVHFGRLAFRSLGGDRFRTEEVAIKDSNVPFALGEVAMNHYLEKKGHRVFAPLGLIVLEDKVEDTHLVHLVTRYSRGVQTLDTLDWDEMSFDEIGFYTAEAAGHLGWLHSIGIKHGDYFFKNIAIDDIGRVFAIDLEHSEDFLDVLALATGSESAEPQVADIARKTAFRITRRELRELKVSLEEALKGRASNGKIYKIVKDSILESYVSGIDSDINKSVLESSAKEAQRVFREELTR